MKDKDKAPDQDQAPAKDKIKKTTTTVTEELIPPEEVSGLKETDDTRHPAAYPNVIETWAKNAMGGQVQFLATLYKYDKLHKQNQSVVCETADEVLSFDEIGMTYGSGLYRYLVSIPDRPEILPKAVVFRINEVYDERRRAAGLVRDIDTGNGKGSMAESMEILKTFAEMFKAMAPAPASAANDASVISAMIKSNYEFMQGIMKKSFQDTSDMYKSLMLKDISGDEPGQDEPEEGNSMKDIIMPLLEKFVPVLLGDGPKAQLTAETIKKLPEFQKLISDNRQRKDIIDAVRKDIGPEKLGKILKRLGVTA